VFAGPASGGLNGPGVQALVAGDIPALAYVSPGRLINTTGPLTGGGDLSQIVLLPAQLVAVTGSGLNQICRNFSI